MLQLASEKKTACSIRCVGYRTSRDVVSASTSRSRDRLKIVSRHTKALSTLSQKSVTVAENGDCRRKRRENGDSGTFLQQYSRTFLRQCGQGLTSHLSLVLDKMPNVSVSSRFRPKRSTVHHPCLKVSINSLVVT